MKTLLTCEVEGLIWPEQWKCTVRVNWELLHLQYQAQSLRPKEVGTGVLVGFLHLRVHLPSLLSQGMPFPQREPLKQSLGDDASNQQKLDTSHDVYIYSVTIELLTSA